jgi:dTDP-4-amino-4,6-dideoxygalactose transaminase
MSEIKFLDLKKLYTSYKDEFDQAYFNVMKSGHYINGLEVTNFEREFAKYSGAKYCVGMGNGLDAIAIALKACDIGPGDEVIVPSFTFIATWLAVSNIGAKVVVVDIDPNSFNIDHSKIEEKITNKTKAILAVYLYGMPGEIAVISKIAKNHNLFFIADAAQAHGARYYDQPIGNLADVTCYSFYPGKNLGAFGDGGAIVSDNEELTQKIKKIGNYGSLKKYYHDVPGVNSRLDELQAAFLRVKLKYLDLWHEKRQAQASLYNQLINKEEITTQQVPSHMISAYHLFVIKTNKRQALQQYLSAKGIETIIHYPISIHKSGAYNDYDVDAKDCAVSENVSHQVLSLPIGPHLELEHIEKVAWEVNGFLEDDK